ncbi:hypothetical protein PENTCL1PPCAC_10759, partial [Pristionchus entomophagus]
MAEPRKLLIPLKNSTDDAERLKSTRRFAIDVWNVTRRWAELAVEAASQMEKFSTGRMRVHHSRGLDDPSSSDYLSHDARDRLMVGVVRAHESLTDTLDHLERQIGKLRIAQSRLAPMRKLCEPSTLLSPSPASSPSTSTPSTPTRSSPLASLCSPSSASISSPSSSLLEKRGSPRSYYMVSEMERVLPPLIVCLERELAAKRVILGEVGSHAHRGLSNTAIVSFQHEPFVEESLLNELYALIEVIEMNVNELPEGDDILGILKDEAAKLHVWITTAVEYYKQKRYEIFTKILENSGGQANLDYYGFEKDQVRALDTLAAYYVKKGHRERGSKEKKKDLFTKATLLYTTADKIIMYDLTHLLGRALFCLLEGNKIDQADQQFTFVLQGSNDIPNIPALLGKACIAFQKKDYTQALFYYKKALRTKPDCPADVRVGLGHCFVKLNKMEYARQAFERALFLDPSSVAALCAISIMDSNLMTEEGVKNGVQLLYRAYKLEPENPIVLNHLSNHFFYKGELAKVDHLAWAAFQYADTESIRAESCFQLARSLHRTGQYDKAFRYYYQSTQFASPSFILPFYGLGQMYIQRKEYTNAINCFEKILGLHPNNTETLKILGSLYAQAGAEKKGVDHRAKARTHLQKYVELIPDDAEVLIELAQLTEHSDPIKSMQYYEKVCDLLAKEEMDVPPEIINNMGSLSLAQGDYEKARDYYQKAMDILANESGDEIDAFRVTIMYNQARAAELLCLFDTAEALYKDVLRKDGQYVDSFLRLGCIARDRGQIYESSVWFKECMGVSQTSSDAWTLIGMLHMNKQEWQPAQKKFEHILKVQQGPDDTYSMIALGNIWLETLFNANRNKEKDKAHQDRALQWFTKALKCQPKNMWAANGIGCVLAVKKQTQEAREIFSQVREATAEFLDVWINIAHVYMEQGQYVAAVQMYLNAIKKFGKENDSQLLLYLARAYHRTGKLVECRETLEKATLVDPENLVIKFNHALTLQRQATMTMKDEKATYQVVDGAIQDLKTAQRIFEYMMSLREEARASGISYTFTETQCKACADLLKQAQIYLERARQQDEEEKALKDRQKEERAALKRRLEEEEREKRESKQRQVDDLKQTRQLYIQMTKDILKLPEIKDDDRKSRGGGGGRGRKRKDGEEFVNDSSDMGDWERGEGGEKRERKKKEGGSRKRRERDRGGSGSDEEGGEKRRKKKKREPSPKLSAKQSAKIKSRAFISDDDSSGDEKPVGETSIQAKLRGGDSPTRLTTAFSSSSSSPTDSSEEEQVERKKKGGKSGKKGGKAGGRARTPRSLEVIRTRIGEGDRRHPVIMEESMIRQCESLVPRFPHLKRVI